MVAVTEQHDLYGLPLEQFVSTRGTLAKALRGEGRREDAKEVSSLRKPSVAAWAVNQLVRTRRREIAALFVAGDALQDAQSQLLEGRGDGRALREAVAGERDAVGELTEQARGLLSSDGHELTQTTIDRVSETLHAAALDEDARAQVKDACLARELRHVGLGQSAVVSVPASPPRGRAQKRTQLGEAKGATSKPPPRTEAGARESEAARRAEAKRLERDRAERLKVARRAQLDARRAAERAERQQQTAQARRDAAAESLREAEAVLVAARENAEHATLELDRASQVLDRS